MQLNMLSAMNQAAVFVQVSQHEMFMTAYVSVDTGMSKWWLMMDRMMYDYQVWIQRGHHYHHYDHVDIICCRVDLFEVSLDYDVHFSQQA